GARPGYARAFCVLNAVEIALAKAEHRGAIHLGVPAYVVELAWAEGMAGAVIPRLCSAVAILDKHGFRVPVLRLARQALPTLQNHASRPRAGQAPSGPGPAPPPTEGKPIALPHTTPAP